jgi:F-type H+-transporting ATPase subunit b
MTPTIQRTLRLVVVATCLTCAPWDVAADPQPAAPAHAADDGAVAAEGAGGDHAAAEEAHGESLGSLLSRLANFAILVGGLYYLLRSPLGNYLNARSQQIREGLRDAAEMKANAARQVAEIDARMRALPGELEALRERGAEEIAAEGARIKHVAEAERQRLVEQTQREIDLRLQMARRDLTRHAAELAVDVATTRLKTDMTDADQQRLVDRYVSEVRTGHD